MNIERIASKIIALKTKDESLRKELMKIGLLSDGYNEEMEALHIKNAEELDRIIEDIGYPTIDKVGILASEAAWLVIQHSISLPGFMNKCLKLLEAAVKNQKADPLNLAYLSDRIAVFEGKLQKYGTQFDWDENGEMSPYPYDDLLKVNERRELLGLNSLEEQTKEIRKRIKDENQHPPKDLLEREREYDKWRKKVGWIK